MAYLFRILRVIQQGVTDDRVLRMVDLLSFPSSLPPFLFFTLFQVPLGLAGLQLGEHLLLLLVQGSSQLELQQQVPCFSFYHAILSTWVDRSTTRRRVREEGGDGWSVAGVGEE